MTSSQCTQKSTQKSTEDPSDVFPQSHLRRARPEAQAQHDPEATAAAHILLQLRKEDRAQAEAARALLALRYQPTERDQAAAVDDGEETEEEDWANADLTEYWRRWVSGN